MIAAPPRVVTPRRVIGLVLWAAALWGVAQCRHVFGGHSFCGPWGCGPSAGALLGAHGLWVVVLVPAAAIAGARLPRNWAVRLGAFLVVAGAVGTAAYLAWDLRTRLAAAPEGARPSPRTGRCSRR